MKCHNLAGASGVGSSDCRVGGPAAPAWVLHRRRATPGSHWRAPAPGAAASRRLHPEWGAGKNRPRRRGPEPVPRPATGGSPPIRRFATSVGSHRGPSTRWRAGTTPRSGASDVAAHQQQPRVEHRGGVGPLDVLEERDIDRAGAVVEGQEHHPAPTAHRRVWVATLTPATSTSARERHPSRSRERTIPSWFSMSPWNDTIWALTSSPRISTSARTCSADSSRAVRWEPGSGRRTTRA